jgi:hypothetical protein
MFTVFSAREVQRVTAKGQSFEIVCGIYAWLMSTLQQQPFMIFFPVFQIRFRIQEGKNDPKSRKKLRISCFEVLDVLF